MYAKFIINYLSIECKSTIKDLTVFQSFFLEEHHGKPNSKVFDNNISRILRYYEGGKYKFISCEQCVHVFKTPSIQQRFQVEIFRGTFDVALSQVSYNPWRSARHFTPSILSITFTDQLYTS